MLNDTVKNDVKQSNTKLYAVMRKDVLESSLKQYILKQKVVIPFEIML